MNGLTAPSPTDDHPQAGGPTDGWTESVAKVDLPYLWRPRIKGRDYAYYRRTISEPEGTRRTVRHRLKAEPGTAAFLREYERIHSRHEGMAGAADTGTLDHVIREYRASPEFREKAEKTRKDYRRYLDLLSREYGDLHAGTMPRDFVLELRDKFADRPRTANYIVAILRLLLNFAGDRRETFGLPREWHNPALRPKRLRTGDGHRPWEEHEISAFRARWGTDTRERVALELLLNSGQRGGDVIEMARPHYVGGELFIVQNKTRVRLVVPASAELSAVLDPWLKAHRHMILLPTNRGRMFTPDGFRHWMRDAYRAAGLPADCTTYGLRYTAATVLNELGCDWETVAAITGHETSEMARKYMNKRRKARLAVRRLDDAREERKEAGTDKQNRPE